jgi:hypothetical protein
MKVATVTCSIHNPNQNMRFVFDGLGHQVRLFPNQTRDGISLAKSVADEMIARNVVKLTNVKAGDDVAVADLIKDSDDSSKQSLVPPPII